MNQSHVLFNELPATYGKLGLITLNRPQALNALSGEMILALSNQLHDWADDPNILAVIIHSAGDKAFCAGGDLKLVYNHGSGNIESLTPFFRTEYKLNLLIHEYPKPYIALVNGITMGGGVGISVNGSRVIATENLTLAMPETGIGFFPDVGAAHFFARCPYHLGMYLGLTGNSIGVGEALFAKLIDAHIANKNLQDFIKDLTMQDLRTDALDIVDQTIAKYQHEPTGNALLPYISIIESCFKHHRIEGIIAALLAEGSPWAQQQAAILNRRSPTSLKITLEHLHRNAATSLANCLEIDFNLAMQLFQQHDIYEGIRAVLIDKTQDAKWQPNSLAEVPDQLINSMFQIQCKL